MYYTWFITDSLVVNKKQILWKIVPPPPPKKKKIGPSINESATKKG